MNRYLPPPHPPPRPAPPPPGSSEAGMRMAPLLTHSLVHSSMSARRAGWAGGARGFLSGDRAATSRHLPMILSNYFF